MLSELCTDYDQKNVLIEEAKANLDALMRERSEIVKNMAKVVAPKKKFRRAGKELVIVIRPGVNGDTCFLRGTKEDNGLVEVD